MEVEMELRPKREVTEDVAQLYGPAKKQTRTMSSANSKKSQQKQAAFAAFQVDSPVSSASAWGPK